MKKILRIVIFSLLTPFFFTSCNKSNNGIPLLIYDTITVDYQLPQIDNYDPELLDIRSSDTSLFTIKDTSFTNKVVIESNLSNKAGNGNIDFVYNGNYLNYKIAIDVHYPKTLDDAVNAFSLACIKLPANTRFNITFDYNNQLDYIKFDESLEIYGWRGIVKYYGFDTGNRKTNTFEVNTDASYGTIPSKMVPGDDNYQYNIASLNTVLRFKNNDNSYNQDFYIDHVEKTLNIKNSEELFWSVEHGYRPIIPESNANLNTIYGNARTICETIYNSSRTNLVNFMQLYDYLSYTTHYDYDPNLSQYGSDSMSYYLEGTLLDISETKSIGVCDAFSKTYALLCGIVGLPCFRSYGFPEGENTGHAWNYVQLDNKWYLVCPTWSKVGFSLNSEYEEERKIAEEYYGKSFSITKYDSFLASKNYFKYFGANYSDLAWPSVVRSDTPYAGNVDEKNYHICSDSDAAAINSLVSKYLPAFSESCLYVEFDKNESKEQINKWANIILSNLDPSIRKNWLKGESEDCIIVLFCFRPS